MDRAYVLPCQKANFDSCEGCPKADCHSKHYLSMEPEVIHA